MDYRIIKAPSASTVAILQRRMGSGSKQEAVPYEAIGLVQGKLIDMMVAVDIAEKSAGVVVEDIRGTCPQNLILIAVLGDTAAVETAMQSIYNRLDSKCKGVLG